MRNFTTAPVAWTFRNFWFGVRLNFVGRYALELSSYLPFGAAAEAG
jgi:hypothetical protein